MRRLKAARSRRPSSAPLHLADRITAYDQFQSTLTPS